VAKEELSAEKPKEVAEEMDEVEEEEKYSDDDQQDEITKSHLKMAAQ